MNILITGGLGFVGTQLAARFLTEGHVVTLVDHAPGPAAHTPAGTHYVAADTTVPGTWQDKLAAQDVVVNLAGATVFQRWNRQTKRRIYDSRILTTRNIAEVLASKTDGLLCSTSAIGYYGFRGDEVITEKDEPGNDFLARLSIDWEKEAAKAGRGGLRVVITRFGIVLGKTGGALGQMIPAFKKFVGGPLGSGEQWFSWIHMEDLLRAFSFLFRTPALEGPVNCCAPNPVRNKELAAALGKALNRPAFFTTPAFALRLALGEFASALLNGQRVVPARLLEQGFTFKYPEIAQALEQVVH